MHVLSSPLFQNRAMILFVFKMQDMHSSNLSGIHNITSFSKCRALLPQGYLVNRLAATNQNASPAQGEARPLKAALRSLWEVPARQRGSDSAQWEVGGAVRTRAEGHAQPAPLQHIRTRPAPCGPPSSAGLGC